jgi:hypothetical protein
MEIFDFFRSRSLPALIESYIYILITEFLPLNELIIGSILNLNLFS